jgi:hypothetical protein
MPIKWHLHVHFPLNFWLSFVVTYELKRDYGYSAICIWAEILGGVGPTGTHRLAYGLKFLVGTSRLAYGRNSWWVLFDLHMGRNSWWVLVDLHMGRNSWWVLFDLHMG